jgi:tripartite ATP-independent transporter DctM subunit
MGVDPQITAIVCIAGLFVFMMMGIPIVYSLGSIAVIGGLMTYGPSSLFLAGSGPFSNLFKLAWTPLPLFILIGDLIAASGMGQDLFHVAANWLSRLKGGLIVAGIIGEAVLSAALGTSAATVIVVGRVAVPEFEKQGYNRGFALGALLAGGVLGPLIPPGATFIIYAVLTNVSLGQLFIAGIMPGILLVFFLAVPAVALSYMRPNLAPKTYSVPWRERFKSLKDVWSMIIIMLAILGSLYFGIATATETAGIGVFVVLVLGILAFKMRWKGIKTAIKETATVNGMILFIIVTATFYTYIIGSTNIAAGLQNIVGARGLSPMTVMIIINVIYLILGCILDPITITLLTIPIFVPLITKLGFDPIWFGVIFCVNTQIGLITPPMGVDLFAVKTVFNIPTMEILKGVTPFLLAEIVFLAVLIAFPQISLWLPNMMVGK